MRAKSVKEDMGGVSSPGATLTNVPGVGSAVPAANAGMNTDGATGSGDNWGDTSIGMQTNEEFVSGESERSIDLRGESGNAHVILSTAHNLAKQLQEVDPERYDPARIREEMMSGDYKNLVHTFEKYFGDYVKIYNADVLDENNLNPYDKIGAMMAKKMGVAQPFKKKDSRTNTIEQEHWEELDEDQPDNTQDIDEYVAHPDKVLDNAKKRKVNEEEFTIATLDDYVKASKHVPDHPLTLVKKEDLHEEVSPREQDELKDSKAKNELKDIGIPFIYKEAPSGKHRVYIEGDVNDVVDKLEDLGWEEVGTNDENTIKKFRKDEKELAIFADGKDLPRVTLTPVDKDVNDVVESILANKFVPNSIESYI